MTRSSPPSPSMSHRAEHSRVARGVGEPLGLAELAPLTLVNQHQLVRGEQGEVIAPVPVQVAHRQGRSTLDGLARVDSPGAAEDALPLVDQHDELGRIAVKGQVGTAVAVEIAGLKADDLLVDRHAHQPHPLVARDLVRLPVIGGCHILGAFGLLAPQEQVDARPAVVDDEDVVDLSPSKSFMIRLLIRGSSL